jgi:hypothetical protein
MTVQKTVGHQGHTLAHGHFEVRETIHVCAAGCRDDEGHRVTARQPAVAEVLMPRRQVGYDVMTFIGLARFVEHRQREEIRADLHEQCGLTLSTGEISALARLFLTHLKALHEEHAQELAKALAADGGWPLHIDATGEDGRGTLLVAYAGWRRWVLGSWKIPTERADAILPRLRAIETLFGAPCAIMRDLGKAVIEAARNSVGQRPIPVLSCAFHFLKDVGKDLLTDAHNELRGLFRRFKVAPRLRELARDIGRGLGPEIDEARQGVTQWLLGPTHDFRIPEGAEGLGVVRALAQWALDYHQDGRNEGFPFDQPLLDFYRRCRTVLRAVEAALAAPWDDVKVRRTLERLHRILNPVRTELPFQRPAAVAEVRVELFTELREALRLRVKPEPGTPLSSDEQAAELRDIKAAVEALTASLRERRPERGPAQNMREAIDLILDHLNRHGPSLWGHAIALPASVGGGVRLVDRTNLLLEGFFHRLKHAERRRSGRAILTQDLEQLPAEAVLAFNLTRADYVAILCGSLEQLHHAFARLDQERRRPRPPRQEQAPAEPQAQPENLGSVVDHADPSPDDAEPDSVSSSMPIADRKIIRAETMEARLARAVASRPPRWQAAR